MKMYSRKRVSFNYPLIHYYVYVDTQIAKIHCKVAYQLINYGIYLIIYFLLFTFFYLLLYCFILNILLG
jgi:hypothetical protein